MPIRDYDGQTFVAFVDISGFKQLMETETRAHQALDHFYRSAYQLLQQTNFGNTTVEGLFVSDCGILFARNDDGPPNTTERLVTLLRVVEALNKKMLSSKYMLTCSIAYGSFSYHGKIEFAGIEKNPIVGQAYLKAYLDNESQANRIQPGQCRIIKEGLPELSLTDPARIDPLIRVVDEGTHYHFYWMTPTPAQIIQFKSEYSDSYNLKYAGMLQALKRASRNR
jgi:hypothetical protein